MSAAAVLKQYIRVSQSPASKIMKFRVIVVEAKRAQGDRKAEGSPTRRVQATPAAEERPCDSRVRQPALDSVETDRELIGARAQLGDRDQGWPMYRPRNVRPQHAAVSRVAHERRLKRLDDTVLLLIALAVGLRPRTSSGTGRAAALRFRPSSHASLPVTRPSTRRMARRGRCLPGRHT